jgi:hypothetical protein
MPNGQFARVACLIGGDDDNPRCSINFLTRGNGIGFVFLVVYAIRQMRHHAASRVLPSKQFPRGKRQDAASTLLIALTRSVRSTHGVGHQKSKYSRSGPWKAGLACFAVLSGGCIVPGRAIGSCFDNLTFVHVYYKHHGGHISRAVWGKN